MAVREFSLESSPIAGAGYTLLTSLVVPRPIAWITTVDEHGTPNAAPFSFFTVASEDPPILSVTFLGAKDTLTNLRSTRECVVHAATQPLLDLVNATGANHPGDVDELAFHRIATGPSVRVRPPRIVNSPTAMECVLDRLTEVGNGVIAYLRVVHVAVHEDVLSDPASPLPVPDPARLRMVSRWGGVDWGLPPAITQVPRARWADLRDQ